MSDARGSEEPTPEEREGFRRLPRERTPGDLLEERVVRALRARDLLAGRPGSDSSRGRWRPPSWLVAAAAVVLFLSGVGVGQWMGVRTTTGAFRAVREQDAARAADQVQAAGSAYVRALTRFAQLSPDSRPEEVTQGREAALGALVAASEILVLLEPGDPALGALVRVLEERRGSPPDTTSTHRVYWF